MDLNTFSIVAHCEIEEAWGVAVASKFPAVGALVPWAQAGVGAVATQSYAKISFGPDGLALMRDGLSAENALRQLLDADEQRANRASGARGQARPVRGAYRRRMSRLGRA